MENSQVSGYTAKHARHGHIADLKTFSLCIFSLPADITKWHSFNFGFPVPQSQKLSVDTQLAVVDAQQNRISANIEAVGFWPNGTIRWVSVEISLSPGALCGDYFLVQTEISSQTSNQSLIESKDGVDISLAYGELNIAKHRFMSLSFRSLADKPIHSNFCLALSDVHADILSLLAQNDGDIDGDNNAPQTEVNAANWQLESVNTSIANHQNQNAANCHKIEQYAHYVLIPSSSDSNDNAGSSGTMTKRINLKAEVTIWTKENVVDLHFSIHNPLAVHEHSGKWDLGDLNSIQLKHLSIDGRIEGVEHQTLILDDKAYSGFESAHLTQHSSGGENWNCANHVEADNKVRLEDPSAALTITDKAEKRSYDCGRASPALKFGGSEQAENNSLIILPVHFWEKFPSALDLIQASNKATSANLQYMQTGTILELQAGETKSHRLLLGIGNSELSAKVPPVKLNTEHFCDAKVLPWFDQYLLQDDLQNMINKGLDGESNFFAKREALDEFGWRNYGDIYADHEAHKFDGKLPFISHYNNQYDPLYSFYKQFMLSGEISWKSLADDLLDHTLNIDIYRTELDKPDYNNGLFWHTDHYVQACTATHRTYSKYQASGVYSNHAGSGGPGPHHCYPSGLALSYFLTADRRAKETVLNMAQWMANIYESDGSLLGKLLQLKNAQYVKVPFKNKLLLGTGTGTTRNSITNQYPLDRGTGNYLNVLLDAYDVSLDEHYLSEAERVIVCTIDSDDKLSDGRFDDIEGTWFYTVFLQAVAKYLYILGAMKLSRPAAQTILSTFLHYIDYILQHEKLYLDQADKLEYANDTWTAQDIRKVQLLGIGSWFVNENKAREYREKSQALHRQIVERLENSDESEYTRLLVLMMQSYGGVQLANRKPKEFNIILDDTRYDEGALKRSLIKRIARFIRNYSLKNERRSIARRIPKLRKWVGQP
ncbi:hypothetical protein PN836_007550 [Ningiella sp. W23]|uniref:hypothetical protein n=1 Tax=Ningiella sp. W23 TaxID=3023715 RepID=UPI003756E9A1